MSEIFFCTVITESYFNYANVLFESLRKIYGSNLKFYCLIIDRMQMDKENFGDYNILDLKDLNINKIEKMKIYYDGFELCNAVRPSLIKYLMLEKAAKKVIYLDSDIFVVGKFDEIEEKLEECTFSFTPHIICPLALDGKFPNDVLLTDTGVYNSGFWAFKLNEKAIEILDWLISRHEIYCFNDISNKMFVDQKLLPMVTTLYKDYFYCLDSPGYNIAYWNLQERPFKYVEDSFMLIDNRRVVFFHLSGFDQRKPQQITKYEHRVSLQQTPGFQSVIKKYLFYLTKSCDKHSVLAKYNYNYFGELKLNIFRRRYYFRHHTFNGLFLAELRYKLALFIHRIATRISR